MREDLTECDDSFSEIPETLYGLRKRLQFIAGVLRKLDRPTVLDIGCGNGLFLALPLARRGFRITGTDIHEPSIMKANLTAKNLPSAKFLCVDFRKLDETFDVVILSEVIEHVTEPAVFLAAVNKCLAPGGKLILTLPNGHGPFEISQYFWNRNFLWLKSLYLRRIHQRGHESEWATDNEESPHINFFSWRKVKQLIRASGFAVAHYRGTTFISGSYSGIVMWMLKKAKIPTGWIERANARVADYLPPQVVSDWMFVCTSTAGQASLEQAQTADGRHGIRVSTAGAREPA
jgi:SAM-dependent methyltransferase